MYSGFRGRPRIGNIDSTPSHSLPFEQSPGTCLTGQDLVTLPGREVLPPWLDSLWGVH
jgi:hypothetical protein